MSRPHALRALLSSEGQTGAEQEWESLCSEADEELLSDLSAGSVVRLKEFLLSRHQDLSGSLPARPL